MSLLFCFLLGVDPLVSVGAAQRGKPAPVVVPAGGCEEGCKCNGTGEEPSGDGILVVNCRCDDGCKCKKPSVSLPEAILGPIASEPVCRDGSCGKPASGPVCVGGSCSKPASGPVCVGGSCSKPAAPARRGIFGRWRR